MSPSETSAIVSETAAPDPAYRPTNCVQEIDGRLAGQWRRLITIASGARRPRVRRPVTLALGDQRPRVRRPVTLALGDRRHLARVCHCRPLK